MSDYSTAELLAVVLSRELQDEHVGILGTRSETAYAACRLAQRTTAPGLWFMSGPSGVVNPGVDTIAPIADYALFPGSEALSDLTDNLDFIDWSHRFFDFAVLGGLQVDRYGNLNTVAVGDWHQPKLRGPGSDRRQRARGPRGPVLHLAAGPLHAHLPPGGRLRVGARLRPDRHRACGSRRSWRRPRAADQPAWHVRLHRGPPTSCGCARCTQG